MIAEAFRFVQTANQLLASNDRDGAIQNLKMALDLDPNCHVALFNLGVLLNASGSRNEALSYSERALELLPNDPQSIGFVAGIYIQMGRFDDAASLYRRLIQLNPGVARYYQNLGMVLLSQGLNTEAEALMRQAIALDPAQSQGAFSALARILGNRGDLTGAAAMSRKSYEYSPGSAVGVFNLAEAFLYEQDLEEAERCAREALAIDPKFAGSYALLGLIEQQKGRFDEAESLSKQAIELDPMHGSPYVAIARGRKMTADDIPFIEHMRFVAQSGRMPAQEEMTLRFAIGKALGDTGQFESAMKEFDKANALAKQVFLHGRPFDPLALDDEAERVERLFTKDFYAKHRHLGSESELPIFIVGMLRSGTTLAEQIVSSHPDVQGAGELTFWIDSDLGIVDWNTVRVVEPRLRDVQRAYLELLERLSKGKPRVVNKTPGNYLELGLIHLAFPRAKIIHCMRDPVDTLLSMYMTPNSAPVPFGYERESLVYGYRVYQRLMSLFKSVLPPGAILDVQYEDVVADKEPITRRIIEFLGLPWNDSCLHFEDNPREVHNPSMWQVRQPIYKDAVKRWKKYEPWLGAFKEMIKEN